MRKTANDEEEDLIKAAKMIYNFCEARRSCSYKNNSCPFYMDEEREVNRRCMLNNPDMWKVENFLQESEVTQ